MKWIDITQPLDENTLLWPGSEPFELNWSERLSEGGSSNVSAIRIDSHSGSHIDAPLHLFDDGESIGEISLDSLIGNSHVIDTGDAIDIGISELEQADIPTDCRRLLIRSAYSTKKHDGGEFRTDYPALTEQAARWIVDREILLAGIDSPSIEAFRSPTLIVHRILLGHGLAVVEGLDLRKIQPGAYELICLPLRLTKSEACPVRALLGRR